MVIMGEKCRTLPEVCKMSGTLPEVHKMSGTLPEVGKMSGTLLEVRKRSGTLPEVRKMSGTLPEVRKLSGTLPEVRKYVYEFSLSQLFMALEEMFQVSCRENQNIHFMPSTFFKTVPFTR